MTDQEILSKLQAENARLTPLLDIHGIYWRLPAEPAIANTSEAEASRLSTDEKVALFRRLFRGRADVYPVRWESKSTGKSGYAPACANEWRAGVCEKPRIKCSDCDNRLLIPLSDSVIYDHLAGLHRPFSTRNVLGLTQQTVRSARDPTDKRLPARCPSSTNEK